MKTALHTLASILLFCTVVGVLAADANPVLTDGEVRKVDKDAAKITIRHGPIVNLDMPAMTMTFAVKDKALLDQVKAGDKIKFQVERMSGGYAVTRLEAAK